MHISLAAEKIFQIGPIPITNTILTSLMAIFLLILMTLILRFRLRLIPKKLQNLIELVISTLFNLVNDVIGNKEQSKKVFPLVATLFIFILTCNLMGLLPGFGTIGHPPIFRSANADLNSTLAWAIVSVMGTQIIGIQAAGFFKYSKRFINFKKGPIYFFVGILELFLETTKMISFSFRLFGNIFAGEVLLTVMAFLLPYIAPLPFFALEIFVGFIQALIFAMLTLIFTKVALLAVEEE